MWIWRGHTKTRWERLGYDKDAFQLMTRMKGAATRLRLLESLDTPMDRYQLANKLGLDWKSIDRQTEVLGRYGLIREQEAYGRVKMYSITENGRTMLSLVRELDEKSG
jgi:predicted transcriptional regulator